MLILARAVEDFIRTHEADVRAMLKLPPQPIYICADGSVIELLHL